MRRNRNQNAGQPEIKLACIMCGDSKPLKRGLLCATASVTNRHFHCDTCLTSWLSVLNQDCVENPTAFNDRQAKVKCADNACNSNPFQHGQICQHVRNAKIIEKYFQNVRQYENKKLFEDYQTQINEVLTVLKDVVASDAGLSEKLTQLTKKIELDSLQRTLLIQMPNGRQCKECGFGPVTLHACTDIRMHHGEVMAYGHAAVNNACPQCGWQGSDWSEWKPWNGKLPSSISGEVPNLSEPATVSAATRRKRRQCLYFIHGACRRGDNCRFSHNTDSTTIGEAAVVAEALGVAGYRPELPGTATTTADSASNYSFLDAMTSNPATVADTQSVVSSANTQLRYHEDGRGRGHGRESGLGRWNTPGRGRCNTPGRGRGNTPGRGRGSMAGRGGRGSTRVNNPNPIPEAYALGAPEVSLSSTIRSSSFDDINWIMDCQRVLDTEDLSELC